MRSVFVKIINTLIHLVIVFGIIAVPLYYVIGKGEGYFFSIYDIYKEVLIQSISVILFGLYSLRLCLQERFQLRKIKIYLPLALFMGMILISFTQMLNHYEGFIFLKRWLSYYLIIFVLTNCCRTKEQIMYYLNWFVVMGTVLSLYGILQMFNVDFPFLVQNFKGNATDGNPNFTGQYMSMMFPIAFWLAISYLGSKRSALYIFCSVVMAYFILLNKTKGVWVGLAVGSLSITVYMIFMVVTGKLSFEMNAKQKKLFGVIIKVFALLFLGIVLISALTFIPALKNASNMVSAYNVQMRGFILEFTQFKSGVKFFTPADEIDEASISRGDTTMQRILIWQNTLKMVKEHPWLGVGLGNFKISYQPYRSRKEQLSTGPDVFVRRTHNEWLQTLAELGIPGFIFFLMIQGFLYFSAHQVIVRSKNFHIQTLMLGFMMSFIAIFVTSIFGFALQNPNPAFTLWTLVGLFSAYYWMVWYREDYRSLAPAGICLKDVFLGKFVREEQVVEERPIKKKSGKSRKKAARKEADIDPDEGLWIFPDMLKKILMPILIAFTLFGVVSHYWIWKPAHAFYNRQFGQALQRMGRHDKAKILFDKSLEDEPLAWETRFLLANEFAAMNDLEGAKREHTFSLKLNPYHAKGHYNLANTLNKLGETEESLHHYKLAVEYDNMLYQAYLNLGAMNFQKQEYDQCIEFYKMSIEANPKFFSAYYNLAYALCAMGKVGEAIPYLQKAKELNPQNQKVLELERRIQNMIQQHNQQQAQRMQQQAKSPQA